MKARLAVPMLGILVIGLLPAQSASQTAAQPAVSGFRGAFTARRLTSNRLPIEASRVDRQGFPHVAYGGDHAYYATYNGATWLYEIVDRTRGVGSFASLALDRLDVPTWPTETR